MRLGDVFVKTSVHVVVLVLGEVAFVTVDDFGKAEEVEGGFSELEDVSDD